MVCDAHAHTEVEAYAESLEGRGKAGHSGHVLRDCKSIGIHFLDKHCGKGEVDYGVFVYAAVKVQAVVSEILAKAVVPVQH